MNPPAHPAPSSAAWLAWAFVLVWGSGYIASKAGLQHAAPFTFLTLRFSLGLLLLVPLLALLLLGAERVQPLLRSGKQWLFARGDLLVGLVSIGLAAYLGWQGIEGLQLGLGA